MFRKITIKSLKQRISNWHLLIVNAVLSIFLVIIQNQIATYTSVHFELSELYQKSSQVSENINLNIAKRISIFADLELNFIDKIQKKDRRSVYNKVKPIFWNMIILEVFPLEQVNNQIFDLLLKQRSLSFIENLLKEPYDVKFIDELSDSLF